MMQAGFTIFNDLLSLCRAFAARRRTIAHSRLGDSRSADRVQIRVYVPLHSPFHGDVGQRNID